MKAFDVRRTIAAPPETVWARLTDAQGLVAGGLGVRRLEGVIEPGALEFSGQPAPRIGNSIPDLQPSFEPFADGLRRLAEGGAR